MFHSKRKGFASFVLIFLLLGFGTKNGIADTQSYGSYGETGFYGKYEHTTSPASGSNHLTESEKSYFLASPDEQMKIPAAGDGSNRTMYVLSIITMLASLIFYWKLRLNKKIL